MGTQSASDWTLENETAVNVASLLRESVGAFRTYGLHLERFVLDDDLIAQDVTGELRLTRLGDAILARTRVSTTVTLECQRCLREFDAPFEVDFDEQFRVAFDVKNGSSIDAGEDDERFSISENHELDIGEVLRQEIIVGMPMRPDCGEECPGPPAIDNGDETDDVDERMAALAKLLEEQNEQ